MSKRGRKRRDRRKNGANHGKRVRAEGEAGGHPGPARRGCAGCFVCLRAPRCAPVRAGGPV